MLENIAFAIWFLLPAAIANAAPVFAAAVPFLKRWDAPMDGGYKFRGKEILGAHKTWRGLISGIIAATLILWLQQFVISYVPWLQHITDNIDYQAIPVIIMGPLFAIGALGGDAVESFFKRQRGIKSGTSWIPFDQIDYIIGAIIVTLPIAVLSPVQYLWILLIWFIMHVLASYIGWLMGLKKDPI